MNESRPPVRSHGREYICLNCGAAMPIPGIADYPEPFTIPAFNAWKRARVNAFAEAHANCQEPAWDGETLPLGTRVKDRRRVR